MKLRSYRKAQTDMFLILRNLNSKSISKALLPKGSIILNEPYTFYQANKFLFWSLVSGFLLLFFALFIALFNIRIHRKHQKKLTAYADNLETIFNSMPNILILINEEGRVENINHKGVEFVGKVKEDLFGLTGGEVLDCLNAFKGEGCGRHHNCSECPIRTRVVDTFDTGRPHVEEEGQMTFLLNNIETPLDILISTNRLELNDTRNVLLSLTDITDRKKAAVDLQRSEERFKLAMNASQDGIYDWDLDEKTIYYSPGWKRMLGYAPEELPDDFSVWETLTHPDDVKVSWNMLNEVVEGKRKRFEKEFKMRHKDGHWVYILSRASIYKDDSTGRIRIVGTHIDISERKLVERELRLTTEMFQKIFNSQLDAIFVLDNQSPPEVIEVNRAGSAMFGYEPLEMKGKITDIFHVSKNHLLSFRTSLISAFETKGFLNDFEFSMKKKDGSIFPTEHMVVELLDDAGQRNGWISVVRDISDKKQLEERLQQNQKMESIGNLAGGIAHDFNNLLFPIIGMSELLLEDLPPGSSHYDSVQEILKAGKRGGDLVKQILSFSRQDEHRKIPVRVQQIVKEVIKLSRSTIPADIEITNCLQPDCGLILADPTQLHQIAMNLITNAFHAIEDSGGKIDIKVKEITLNESHLIGNIEKPGKYVMLSVSDNGIGIPSVHLQKIFDPYFTTKEKGKGTGLGLSVVYGLVKDHQGEITVYSEVGEGTTFKVYLPLNKQSVESEKTKKTQSIATGTERILLVDDEISIVALEKKVLERKGYSVVERTSSIDALEAFKAHPDAYDLVISDMNMPNMTGVQLAKEMLTIRPDIPIIICTGFSERISEDIAKDIGVRGFLMKPVVMAEMAKEMRRVLDEAKEQNQT